MHSRNRLTLLVATLAACSIATSTASAAETCDVLYAWGSNIFGQLGIGTSGSNTNSNAPVPVVMPGTGSVTAFAAGAGYAMAIQNGSLYAWGHNGDGRLGIGITGGIYALPVSVTMPGAGSVTAFAAGEQFSFAVQNNTLYAWGLNAYGTLGNGTNISSNLPVEVAMLGTGNITDVAAGTYHGLAIQNGSLYAWGRNSYGQLGNGTDIDSNLPVQVAIPGMGNVTAIATGSVHSLAIRNGVLYAWGYNSDGQLGIGTSDYNIHNSPEWVMSGVTAIAAAGNTSMAIKDGGVWVWGSRLTATPTHVFDTLLTDIVDVATGGSSFYALGEDGSLWAWGDNSDGKLGLGTTGGTYATPQLVGTGYTSISATNGGFVLAIRTVPVPEPASLGFLAVGAAALFSRRRRT
ncbi:MAG: PEP-CTERM sorting domain-containing protein [Phycisphaerales bacterium]|nr:PEP-CTERM sorting domain-containing protein [Phycisphaerales bacterium]